MDANFIRDTLKRPGEFAKLADHHDYMNEALNNAERAKAFAEAGVPDPAVIHGWWKGMLDLPKELEHYAKWLGNNVLKFVGVPLGWHYAGSLKAEMERLEHLIRTELGIEPEAPTIVDPLAGADPELVEKVAAEPAPAATTEEPPVPETPRPGEQPTG